MNSNRLSSDTINVSCIGHVNHQTTLLTSAITRVLSASSATEYKQVKELNSTPLRKSIGVSHVEYFTASRRYEHLDCPWVNGSMRALTKGIAQTDGAILVVSGNEGPAKHTEDYLLLARSFGISSLVVFITIKADETADEELTAVVQVEVEELVSRADLKILQTPFATGTPQRAIECGCGDRNCSNCGKIWELLDSLDLIPSPQRNLNAPLLMSIEHVYEAFDRTCKTSQAILFGEIEQGQVQVGDKVWLVGVEETPTQAQVASIQSFGRARDSAKAGDIVSILLPGITRKGVRSSQVLTSPSGIEASAAFEAEVQPSCGLTIESLLSVYRPFFLFRIGEATGEMAVLTQNGEKAKVKVELDRPLVLREGTGFALFHDDSVLGGGVIGVIKQ